MRECEPSYVTYSMSTLMWKWNVNKHMQFPCHDPKCVENFDLNKWK